VRLEQKLETLLPEGDGPFEVVAFELTRDMGSWNVNTPFRIASKADRLETLSILRKRWNVFKANYMPKARVADLTDISDGFDGACNLEVDCTAFADVRKVQSEKGQL